MKDTFYITTPIYYVNDAPHLGHAYSTVACDVVARYHRLRGEKVFFLTGTDEHSHNVAKAAEDHGMSPQEWTDQMEPKWKGVWDLLQISNDDFIRTSEERHTKPVQEFVKLLYENGDVYLGTYEGYYCVSCEEFKQEDQLTDGNCSIHGKPVEWLSEENYFFRFSAYQDRLLAYYEEHPDFVRPAERFNEVISFVKGGLKDFSISRTTVEWGIPVPWDPKHVIYVWVDALQNYITAAGFGSDTERFESIWPADVHMMAKEIVRFHAAMWPALLWSAGLEAPRQVLAHGFLLVSGEKMSKSRLTGIHPSQLTDHFGVDAYRYYFLREISFGKDGSFSWESMVARYNADLANGLGNLVSRVLAMIDSNFEGRVPEPSDRRGGGRMATAAATMAERFDRHLVDLELTGAVAALDEFVREANRYLVEVAPWALAKDPGKRQDLADSLYEAAETLRLVAIFASPVMPGAADRLWRQLGIPEPLAEQRLPEAAAWGGLEPRLSVSRGDCLFPRLEE